MADNETLSGKLGARLTIQQKPTRKKTMTRIIRYEAKQYELQPEGVQRARLSEINDLEPTINSRGKEQERIRFVWGV